MPKIGRKITFEGQTFKVRQHNVLKETIVVTADDGEDITLNKEEWKSAVTQQAPRDK